MHSIVLILVVFLAGSLVARVPLAALAGVLMVTAARMVERHNVLAVVRSTRSDAVVLVLTALATVVFDLIVAVEIGVAAAAFLALRNVAKTASATAEPLAETDDAVRTRKPRCCATTSSRTGSTARCSSGRRNVSSRS